MGMQLSVHSSCRPDWFTGVQLEDMEGTEFRVACIVQLHNFEVRAVDAHKEPHAVLRIVHQTRQRRGDAWYASTPGDRSANDRLPPQSLVAREQEVAWGRRCAAGGPVCCTHCAL